MSNFEWARGQVLLPASELARAKRALRTHHNHLVEAAYDQLKRFRATNLTSSWARWQAALESAKNSPTKTLPQALALRVAATLDRPRAVKWEDFQGEFAKAPVTWERFPLWGEEGQKVGEVRFLGRQMEWEVYWGNHAVDAFRDSEAGRFLYHLMDEGVTWLKGSGGGETYESESTGAPEVSNCWGTSGGRYTASTRHEPRLGFPESEPTPFHLPNPELLRELSEEDAEALPE